ncbi:hypothetical protein OsJ_05489 [Oryza sativa Japonica Group]|uniref:Uncharacterized protein n=1 Tax=Oryza sativa subsp. japonica TaxID=39947 RepID=Q6H7S7_ORYSJ|nr:hypothetical protein OsJ_05489 [Oryza sativa Japonica Group]BAD25222.1 hypothetical protein [Oryza sativa Japonica Group]
MASPRHVENKMASNISRIRQDVSVIKSMIRRGIKLEGEKKTLNTSGKSVLVESLGLVPGLQEVAATFKVIDHINNPADGRSFVRTERFFKSKSHMVMSAAISYSVFYLARKTKSVSEVLNYDYGEFLHQMC